jgi:hypothetical protein
MARFEARSFDDIRALGRNSPEDDRAFAAVARLSERNLSAYRTFLQPFVRALANHPAAALARQLDPLRLSYTMFGDKNPWMSGVKPAALAVASARTPAAADNPFLALQSVASAQITTALEAYRVVRDQTQEQVFFGIYGSPIVQALLGLGVDDAVRPIPQISPGQLQARRARTRAYQAALEVGGFDEALTRSVLYVFAGDRSVDQRCALALNDARQQLLHLSLTAFKILVRDQFFILQLGPEPAVDALPSLVPGAEDRKALLDAVRQISSAGAAPTTAAADRLSRLAQVLAPANPPGPRSANQPAVAAR